MNAWDKVTRDERINELHILKYEALGHLLGMVDAVLLAEDHPDVFCVVEKLTKLRAARTHYDVACAAYLDARMVAK
jgi:hypothetical protein